MNNRAVSHLWANQSRASARGSHFYFEGPTLYSYGPHFPIARVYSHAARGRFVLFNAGSYSVTTSTHQSYARSAASHLPGATVPYIGAGAKDNSDVVGHAGNIAYLAKSLQDCADKAMRRTTESRVQRDAEEAARAHKALADYLAFFGIRRKMPAMPGFAAAFERARKIENPDPASRDKRERASAARRAAKEVREKKARELAAVRRMARRTDWRLGGAFGVVGHSIPYGGEPVMLRVNGEKIETSQGASVPLAAAPMVWAAVQRQVARGQARDFSANRGLGKPRIGDYPLDRIDADGTLHAGCHTIPYSELASMARALGLS